MGAKRPDFRRQQGPAGLEPATPGFGDEPRLAWLCGFRTARHSLRHRLATASDRPTHRVSQSLDMKRGESLAGASGERDDRLTLATVDRIAQRCGGLFAEAGRLEHLG